jgi:hypothetical protein
VTPDAKLRTMETKLRLMGANWKFSEDCSSGVHYIRAMHPRIGGHQEHGEDYWAALLRSVTRGSHEQKRLEARQQ